MNRKIYTQDEVIEILKKQKGEKTLAEFASELGVHPQKIWNILNGKQLPNKSVGFAKNETLHTFCRVEKDDRVHS